MEKMETGNFDIELPVNSRDEIGILSQRFNQMSVTLKKYINEVYVAQIKQNEAELTALKSQIYPHFLYNTLEVIRMTALEDGENKVAEMIEAKISDGVLEISVLDNGVGMDETEVNKIKELFDGDEPGIKNEYNWQSIGLKNVHDRIKYLYGEKYGIHVTSTPNVGTLVSLRMPVREEE